MHFYVFAYTHTHTHTHSDLSSIYSAVGQQQFKIFSRMCEAYGDSVEYLRPLMETNRLSHIHTHTLVTDPVACIQSVYKDLSIPPPPRSTVSLWWTYARLMQTESSHIPHTLTAHPNIIKNKLKEFNITFFDARAAASRYLVGRGDVVGEYDEVKSCMSLLWLRYLLSL
eukprot:GHVR01109132.1.p1 GENE.GHVR01109132.1~~GHVR01109132.1.p1  ORF type:complete len:169 (+),score=58.96 GHVR01109132.1:177-683(+)